MKKVLFSLAAACFTLVACNDDNASGSAGNDKDSSKSNVYRQILKGIETGDSAILAKYISSDATAHGANPDGTDIKGDSLIVMLAQLSSDIKNLKMEVLEEASNDDQLFAVVRMTGTNPAGNKMDSRTVDVIKVKNGKATNFWSYIEHSQVMKTMSADEDEAEGGQ